MSNEKIYTAAPQDLSPPIKPESFCVDVVTHADYLALALQWSEAEARGVDAFTAKLRRDLEDLDPEIFAYGEIKNALIMSINLSEMFTRQLREGKAE